MKGVVLIDLQNEFFCKEGILGDRFIPASSILPAVTRIISQARLRHYPVFWVQSIYDHSESPKPKHLEISIPRKYQGIPLKSDFHASAHFNGGSVALDKKEEKKEKKEKEVEEEEEEEKEEEEEGEKKKSKRGRRKCCVLGSPLSDIHPCFKELMKKEDKTITKRWYSAFTESALLKRLNQKGVKEIYVMGVTTNVCVQATCVDAFFLGYKVTLVSDATFSSSTFKCQKALEEIGRHYATVMPSSQVITSWENLTYGAGDSRFLLNALPEDTINFEAIKKEIEWSQMFHRTGPVPRLVANQGDLVSSSYPIYRHPVDSHLEIKSWTPTVLFIRDKIQQIVGHNLNHALIQYYRDGSDHISEHSDKTLDIAFDSYIVNYSIGCTREFTLRSKEDRKHKECIYFSHNSLFLMGLKTNAQYLHAIKEDNRETRFKTEDEIAYKGERISFTFRYIKTFIKEMEEDDVPLSTEENRKEKKLYIYGQGAGSSFQMAQVVKDKTQYSKLIHSFGVENREPFFNWEEHYAKGFSVIQGQAE